MEHAHTGPDPGYCFIGPRPQCEHHGLSRPLRALPHVSVAGCVSEDSKMLWMPPSPILTHQGL